MRILIISPGIPRLLVKCHTKIATTGAADPRRAEFDVLEQMLAAWIQSGADLAVIANARVEVTVIDRLSERGPKMDEFSSAERYDMPVVATGNVLMHVFTTSGG